MPIVVGVGLRRGVGGCVGAAAGCEMGRHGEEGEERSGGCTYKEVRE